MPALYMGIRDIWGEWWEIWQVGDKLVARLQRTISRRSDSPLMRPWTGKKPDKVERKKPREVAAHDAESLAAAALDLLTEIACEQQS